MVKLVPEARNWWRMFSVQAMIAAGAIQGAWVALPIEFQQTIPDTWLRVATGVIVALGVIGRLVDQPKVHDAEKTD